MKQSILFVFLILGFTLTSCSLDLTVDQLGKELGRVTAPSTDPEDDDSGGGGGAPFVPVPGADIELTSLPTMASSYNSFYIQYGSNVDLATITVSASDIVISTTGTVASCVAAVPWGTSSFTYARITGCTGVGTISISIKPNTAKDLSGAFIAGTAVTTLNLDAVNPTTPTGLTLGANTSVSVSPTITYTAGTDADSGIAKHQVQISLNESPWSTIVSWADHVSGNAVSGLALVSGKQYAVTVKAVDVAGNASSISSTVYFYGYTPTIDCSVGTPAIGAHCHGGAIYAGTFDGGTYMVTPSGCTNSATPSCEGGTDPSFAWNDGVMSSPAIAGVERINAAATPSSTSYRGYVNTPLIAAYYPSTSTAAKFCEDMTFGGYSDWYLASKSEMAYIYCKSVNKLNMHSSSYPETMPNCTSVGGYQQILKGFEAAYYWTSTEALPIDGYAWSQSFIMGQHLANVKNSSAVYVRCVRRY